MSSQTRNTPPSLAELSVPSSVEKTSAGAEGGSSKCPSYKPLPKEFRRDGFNYRQIAREGDVALYEQTWLSCAEPSRSYEVILIRRRDGFQIGEKLIQPYEIYPNCDAWGTDGFTVTDRDKAWAKFIEISLEEPARRRKEVNLKWENPSGSSSATPRI
jgi:hypothetical protein